MKKRNVQYQRCLIVYIDILGFKQKVDTRSANHISRCIRVIAEAVEPRRFERQLDEFADVPSIREKYEWLREYHAKTLKRTRRSFKDSKL